jgi:hypothetical protein
MPAHIHEHVHAIPPPLISAPLSLASIHFATFVCHLLRTEWRQHLRESGKVPDFHQLRMHADMSPIFEQLNLLWANHEIASAPTSDMLDFFEMNTKVSR